MKIYLEFENISNHSLYNPIYFHNFDYNYELKKVTILNIKINIWYKDSYYEIALAY